MIVEYYSRPALAPPLIIINHVSQLVLSLFKKADAKIEYLGESFVTVFCVPQLRQALCVALLIHRWDSLGSFSVKFVCSPPIHVHTYTPLIAGIIEY